MEVETFAFDFTHHASSYSVQVKRFAVDKELHLWTVVHRPRAAELVFTFYEGPTREKIWWRPLNDKRDDLMKLIAKPLAKKVEALKQKGTIKTFRFKD